MVTNYEKETFDWTTKISDNEIAFIIADADKVVYVWNGQKASNVKKYKGGTMATKIKSLYQLYGFRTSTINQGEEVGTLKTEIENLLEGKGSAPVEDAIKAPPKAGPSIAERAQARSTQPAPAIASKATMARASHVDHVETAETPSIPEPGAGKRIKDLETELENEKKKSAHRNTKLKEEMDDLKAKYEKQIADLNAEISSIRKGTVDVAKHEAEIAQLKGEKESLNVLIEGLKKQLEEKEEAAKDKVEALKSTESLQAELDALKGVKDKIVEKENVISGLEKKNHDLTTTITSLQAEIAALKAKAEGAAESKAALGDVEALKQQVATLQKELEAEREKAKDAREKIAEYEEKLKTLENKAASAKEESQIAQRKLIEQKEAAKQMEGLDFASLDEVDTKPSAGGGNGLSFVTPNSGGELGVEIDPLTDLRSFLNTVDPSKQLDPELKGLLDIVSRKIENDADILGDLQRVKKKIKDKALESLIDDAIKSIKNVKK